MENQKNIGQNSQLFNIPESVRPHIYPEENEIMSDGIINVNRKIYLLPNNTPAILCLLFTNAEERIKRELAIREFIGNRNDIPIQNIILSGSEGENFGYLVKEFKSGITLNETLLKPEKFELDKNDISSLAYDLGKYLSLLGSVELPKFGKIDNPEITAPTEMYSWKDNYVQRLNKRILTLKSLDPKKRVSQYQVSDILSLFPNVIQKMQDKIDALDEIEKPYFVHNDFHFLNIIANRDNGKWHITGILDLENALGGDPDFDLISIESQLNLTPEYKNLFMSAIESFRLGYQRKVADNYPEKRWLYHLTWSLSYFEAVMQMDTNIHPITEQIEKYMEKHYGMLKTLSANMNPEDAGAPNLF